MNRFAHYNNTLRMAALAIWVTVLSVLASGMTVVWMIPRGLTDADVAAMYGLQNDTEYSLELSSDHLKSKSDGVVIYLSDVSSENASSQDEMSFFLWPIVPADKCQQNLCGTAVEGHPEAKAILTSTIRRDVMTVHVVDGAPATIRFHFDDVLRRYDTGEFAKTMWAVLPRTRMDITLTQAQADSINIKP